MVASCLCFLRRAGRFFFALGNSGGWGLSTDLVSLAALCCSFPTLIDVLHPSSAGV
nr:MAG TPA: hypothetical protein [Caudoviricetes sp.]